MKPRTNIWIKVYDKYKYIIYTLVFIILTGPFIANDVPIICSSDQGIQFPIINKNSYQGLLLAVGKKQACNWSVDPIIPFNAKTIQTSDRLLPPLSGRHLMGTDSLGRDVFAGMVYGLRVALVIALLSMLVAAMGGIFIGLLAGYFGNSLIKASKIELFFHILGALIWIFIGFGILKYFVVPSIFWLVVFLFLWVIIHISIHRIIGNNKYNKIAIPLDDMIMRSIEIYKAIPALFILLVILGYVRQANIYLIASIIGVLSIPGIARLVRGEILKIRGSDFVTSATLLNFKHKKIMFQQILPNVIGPLSVALSFGAAGAVLAESTLSFLGIGLGMEEVTWGSILTESRKYYSGWWLALMPGTAIFGLILFFNHIGRYIATQYRSETSGL